jgi:uncharacterized protein YjbJ (UPF0337 family)
MVKGSWEEQKGKLKQKISVLLDNDLLFESGRRDEMLEKLQISFGKRREEILAIIVGL